MANGKLHFVSKQETRASAFEFKLNAQLAAEMLKFFLVAFVFFFSRQAKADDPPASPSYSHYETTAAVNSLHSRSSVAPLSQDSAFGESISRSTGSLSFRVTDVALHGRGPDISVTRKFNISANARIDQRNMWHQDFVDWDLDIPKLTTKTGSLNHVNVASPESAWIVVGNEPNKRCSRFGPQPTSWDPNTASGAMNWPGVNLNVPGEGEQALLKRDPLDTSISFPGSASVYPIVTSSYWTFSCLQETKNGVPGEAFLALSPDGTKYWFDWFVLRKIPGHLENQYTVYTSILYPTRIEDRFGNYVLYAWSGDFLTSVTASDGRKIAISYQANIDGTSRISSVVANPGTSESRTWTYTYTMVNRLSNYSLSAVNLPDGSKWIYSLSGLSGMCDQTWGGEGGNFIQVCDVESDFGYGHTSDYVGTITAPSGLVGTFKARNIWRSGLGTTCYADDFFDQCGMSIQALTFKSYGGPGMQPRTWSYRYCVDVGADSRPQFIGVCPKLVAGNFSVIAETGPDNKTNLYTSKAISRSLIVSGQTSSDAGRGIGYLLRVDTDVVLDSPMQGLNQYQPHILTFQKNPPLLLSAKRTVTYDYQLSSAEFTPRVGFAPQVFDNYNPFDHFLYERVYPIKKTTITQDGVSFTSQVEAFDKFARPVTVTRSSAPSP